MIDRQLPEIPLGAPFGNDQVCQHFAVCYLARYNTVPISSRCRLSFERAYGMENLKIFPRVAGGHPGFAMFIRHGGPSPQIIVGIEGTTSLAQLWLPTTGTQSTNATPMKGVVYGPFLAHANAIATLLMEDADFLMNLARPGAFLIFTGFSLGAAIADILHAKFKILRPTKTIYSTGFACPRVGNAEWNDSDNFRLGRHHFYCGWDPIDLIPIVTINGVNNRNSIWQNPIVNYVPPIVAFRYDLFGRDFMPPRGLDYVDAVRGIGELRRPIDGDNSWRYHDYDFYRYMLTSLTTEQVDRWRFWYLEFNNDNSWGQMFPTARGVPGWAKVMAPVPPADVVTEPNVAVAQLRVAERQQNLMQPIQAPIMHNVPAADNQPRQRGTWVPRRTRDF